MQRRFSVVFQICSKEIKGYFDEANFLSDFPDAQLEIPAICLVNTHVSSFRFPLLNSTVTNILCAWDVCQSN